MSPLQYITYPGSLSSLIRSEPPRFFTIADFCKVLLSTANMQHPTAADSVLLSFLDSPSVTPYTVFALDGLAMSYLEVCQGGGGARKGAAREAWLYAFVKVRQLPDLKCEESEDLKQLRLPDACLASMSHTEYISSCWPPVTPPGRGGAG